jgi:signal transduction histidine kinase
VPFELAEVVAGFPLAASFAIAGGITALREGRRRASLNEAVHELRRPLQVLSLSLSADTAAPRSLESSLRMAAAAVDRLEQEINGEMAVTDLKSVSVMGLVEAAVERWRAHAALVNRSLNLRWKAGDPLLRGDELELERALDNLISNAFRHGEGEITIEVREVVVLVRVRVLDSGTLSSPLRRRSDHRRLRLSGRGRHGHGLRIVRRAASRHGGSFHLWGTARGTEARLELPLGGGVG